MSDRVHVYQSLEDMLAACSGAVDAGRVVSTLGRGDVRWVGRGFSSWPEVCEAVQANWEEGLDVFQNMLHELSGITFPPVPCRVRRSRWSEDGGDEVDNDRMRSGQEYWRSMSPATVHGFRTICVVTNVSSNGGVSASEVLWRGALATVLCDLLEKQGYRVELWAVDRSHSVFDDKSGSFQAVCLKSADRPLDTVSVVNAVSSWFYRTVFFQDLHVTQPGEPDGHPENHSYGGATKVRPDDPCVRELIGNALPVVIDDVWNQRQCIDKAREVVASLNQ